MPAGCGRGESPREACTRIRNNRRPTMAWGGGQAWKAIFDGLDQHPFNHLVLSRWGVVSFLAVLHGGGVRRFEQPVVSVGSQGRDGLFHLPGPLLLSIVWLEYASQNEGTRRGVSEVCGVSFATGKRTTADDNGRPMPVKGQRAQGPRCLPQFRALNHLSVSALSAVVCQ